MMYTAAAAANKAVSQMLLTVLRLIRTLVTLLAASPLLFPHTCVDLPPQILILLVDGSQKPVRLFLYQIADEMCLRILPS